MARIAIRFLILLGGALSGWAQACVIIEPGNDPRDRSVAKHFFGTANLTPVIRLLSVIEADCEYKLELIELMQDDTGRMSYPFAKPGSTHSLSLASAMDVVDEGGQSVIGKPQSIPARAVMTYRIRFASGVEPALVGMRYGGIRVIPAGQTLQPILTQIYWSPGTQIPSLSVRDWAYDDKKQLLTFTAELRGKNYTRLRIEYTFIDLNTQEQYQGYAVSPGNRPEQIAPFFAGVGDYLLPDPDNEVRQFRLKAAVQPAGARAQKEAARRWPQAAKKPEFLVVAVARHDFDREAWQSHYWRDAGSFTFKLSGD